MINSVFMSLALFWLELVDLNITSKELLNEFFFNSFELITNPMSYLMLVSTTACSVDLVYWILWLILGMLVLVGNLN